MSPVIPRYTRQQSIPGQSGEVMQNPANAGVVSGAMAGAFKVLGNEAEQFGDILIKRKNELQKQVDDNYLIGEGSKLNKNFSDFRFQTEQNPKYQSGDYGGMIESLTQFSKTQYDGYGDTLKDKPELQNKIKEHIKALEFSATGHFSTISQARIKTTSETVRKTDLESSEKMAQMDYTLAIKNWQKTLDAQKANGSLSPELYNYELQTGNSKIAEAHINALLAVNPVGAEAAFNTLKGVLTADTQERLKKIVAPSVEIQTGRDIGRDIFRNDKSGSLETMENLVKDKKLAPKVEDAAISEIKSSWNTRKIDEVKEIKDTNSSMIVNLSKKAVNGINQERDLTPAQWALWIKTDAHTAAAFQDKIRKENAEIARMDAQQRIEAEKVKRQIQTENENAILLLPENDFLNIDMQKEMGLGNISREGGSKLTTMQTAKDPLKNEAVKRALTTVNQGMAIADTMKITGAKANEIAAWKGKYSNLVIAFAYNNFDKPDFETKLQEFMDEQIMEDMVTYFFSSREAERKVKYKQAQEVAGELPQKAKQRVGKEGQPELAPIMPKEGDTKILSSGNTAIFKGGKWVLKK